MYYCAEAGLRHPGQLLLMTLRIETFDNTRGGNTLYKALTHPGAARPAQALLAAFADHGPVAIYDPHRALEPFEAVYSLERTEIAGVYVQHIAGVGSSILGCPVQPVTELARSRARAVFVAAFDSERIIAQMRPYLPDGAAVHTLDALRLPAGRLTNRRRYLDPLNFATNFAFFRDTDELHTRLVTVNYWSGYGATEVACWLTLFAEDGEVLAEWRESFEASGGTIILDSRKIRACFGLPEFTGQLFFHVVGAAGHDVVKYSLDIFGEASRGGCCSETLSCTHDANAWPTDMPGCPLPLPASASCYGFRTATRCRSRRGPSASIRWARIVLCRSPGRLRRSPPAPSTFLSCCRMSTGRGRLSCVPASTWCAHVTRSLSGTAVVLRMSMSNAPIWPRTRSSRVLRACSERDICFPLRSCRGSCGRP